MAELQKIEEPLSGKDAIKYGKLAKEHAISAVEYAIKCGEFLAKVKKELPHGEFTSWIEINMPVTLRQCQKFMSISSYLIDTKSEVTALLESNKSIDQLAAEASIHKSRMAAKAKMEETKKSGWQENKVSNKAKLDPINKDEKETSGANDRSFNSAKETMAAGTAMRIFGINPLLIDTVSAIYKAQAMKKHPDKNGTEAEFKELNDARAALIKYIGDGK